MNCTPIGAGQLGRGSPIVPERHLDRAGQTKCRSPKEERREILETKRKIVQNLVEKVLIGKDRKLFIVFRLDVLSLIE